MRYILTAILALSLSLPVLAMAQRDKSEGKTNTTMQGERSGKRTQTMPADLMSAKETLKQARATERHLRARTQLTKAIDRYCKDDEQHPVCKVSLQ